MTLHSQMAHIPQNTRHLTSMAGNTSSTQTMSVANHVNLRPFHNRKPLPFFYKILPHPELNNKFVDGAIIKQLLNIFKRHVLGLVIHDT